MAAPSTPSSALALGAAFVLGLVVWVVPLAAYALAFFFTVGHPDFGARELLGVACLAAVVALALPLGLMVWRRRHQAALAFAVGALVGVGPLVAFVAWLSTFVVGRH